MSQLLAVPDDVAEQVRRQAEQRGQVFEELAVEILRRGLLPNAPTASEPPTPSGGKTQWGVSPVTGLPMILCPPDAPAWSMTAEQLQAIADATQLEEDLARLGIPLR